MAAHRLIQAFADQVADIAAAVKPTTRWSPSVGRATQLGLEPIAKLLCLGARHDAEFPLERLLHTLVLPDRAADVAAGGARPHQGEMGVFVCRFVLQ
jgi:hypothetical protein